MLYLVPRFFGFELGLLFGEEVTENHWAIPLLYEHFLLLYTGTDNLI